MHPWSVSHFQPTCLPLFLFHLCRNDILLLLDLKAACDACEFELQSLRLAAATDYYFERR